MIKRDIKEKSRKKKGLASLRGRSGQSTVEYIILVAAVIGALIIFLPGVFRDSYEATLESGTDGMDDMAARLAGSRGTQPVDVDVPQN